MSDSRTHIRKVADNTHTPSKHLAWYLLSLRLDIVGTWYGIKLHTIQLSTVQYRDRVIPLVFFGCLL